MAKIRLKSKTQMLIEVGQRERSTGPNWQSVSFTFSLMPQILDPRSFIIFVVLLLALSHVEYSDGCQTWWSAMQWNYISRSLCNVESFPAIFSHFHSFIISYPIIVCLLYSSIFMYYLLDVSNLIFFIRERGGREAEREERDRWINKERQKIMDSVHGE